MGYTTRQDGIREYDLTGGNEPSVSMINKCIHCQTMNLLKLPQTGFIAWREHKVFVQNAFPELPVDARELIISGTHTECWDALWKDLEEDEAEDCNPDAD
jgi:hypothetical protein